MPKRKNSPLRVQLIDSLRQMDWFRGLRAAVALTAPIVLGNLVGLPDMRWAALGGFESTIADNGGPYRLRLGSLVTLILGGAAGLFLGALVGGHPLAAVLTTLFFCFLWSYLAVLGQPFASAGVLVQLIFICGLGAPTNSYTEALGWTQLFVFGGIWAAVLALFLWPLDAYRPARAAVADCYNELASFLNSVTELAKRDHQPPALWHRLARHHQYRVRRAVEQGWQAIAAIRARRQAETPQGNHLVVLLEHADLLIARTIALAEHLESLAATTVNKPCNARSLEGLAELQTAERWIASILRRRGEISEAQSIRGRLRELPALLASGRCDMDATSRFLQLQVTDAASELDSSIESVVLLRSGRNADGYRNRSGSTNHFAYVAERLHQLRENRSTSRSVDLLIANFTRSSLMLRHAARVAIVCSLDETLIHLLRIDHGYWLLLTSLIVLQPHVSGTLRRGLERIGGTVAGGVLAAVLAYTLHSQMSIAAVLFPLALFALAFLPVSYSFFSFFLTPTFVLAWLPYTGDWRLAMVRIGDTFAGALIALFATRFLFPAFERQRSAGILASSIRADRRYLNQLASAWRSHSRATRLLADARRATGLAHNDTEESLDRLMSETWPRRRPFAQFVISFVTYLRRFAQTVTALNALDEEWNWKQSETVQGRLDLVDRRMAWLEEETSRAARASDPAAYFSHVPWPEASAREMQPPNYDHPGERLMEKLERQVEVLQRQLQTLRQQGWLAG